MRAVWAEIRSDGLSLNDSDAKSRSCMCIYMWCQQRVHCHIQYVMDLQYMLTVGRDVTSHSCKYAP